jgi:hypothetical protein
MFKIGRFKFIEHFEYLVKVVVPPIVAEYAMLMYKSLLNLSFFCLMSSFLLFGSITHRLISLSSVEINHKYILN